MTVVKSDSKKIVEADIFFRAESFANDEEQIAVSQSGGGLLSSLRLFASPVKFFENVFTIANIASAAQLAPSASKDEKFIYVIGVHELGHFLGRVHAKKHSESIMFPTVGLKSVSSPFANYDIDIMQNVYDLHESH